MIGNDLNSDSFESLFKSHFGIWSDLCSYVNDVKRWPRTLCMMCSSWCWRIKEIDTLSFEVLPVYLIQELRLWIIWTFACRAANEREDEALQNADEEWMIMNNVWPGLNEKLDELPENNGSTDEMFCWRPKHTRTWLTWWELV